MTKGKIPRQRRFQFLFNMPLRDVCVCFSGNIKPKKMRNLNCIFHGSSTIWFRLQPSQSKGHCSGVGTSAKYFLVSCLFQASRWTENGASREQREITRGVEIEIIESLARWRSCFYCQGIRPTQLIDPQLIMHFVFTILSLLNKWTQMHP